ncbi:MAG: hypothetical protein GXY83_32355, partial [Rhodopirellula sp.]|nr:hypothetical protein [Rhodopirellula sp.]
MNPSPTQVRPGVPQHTVALAGRELVEDSTGLFLGGKAPSLEGDSLLWWPPFPVFDTKIGRIGCLICMDTTVCESARLLGLHGADFICFPIMGDLRADRWSPGPPIYNEDRWKVIMRTRATRRSSRRPCRPKTAAGSGTAVISARSPIFCNGRTCTATTRTKPTSSCDSTQDHLDAAIRFLDAAEAA